MKAAHELDTAAPLKPRRPPPVDTGGDARAAATPTAAAASSPSLQRLISADTGVLSPAQPRSAATPVAASAIDGGTAHSRTPSSARQRLSSAGDKD